MGVEEGFGKEGTIVLNKTVKESRKSSLKRQRALMFQGSTWEDPGELRSW
jgi:hypothetical protein